LRSAACHYLIGSSPRVLEARECIVSIVERSIGRVGARLRGVSDLVDARPLILALVVGTLSGLGAAILAALLDAIHHTSFERLPALLPWLGDRSVVLVP
jgi:hypothetical protein